jgi:hypothetical protein
MMETERTTAHVAAETARGAGRDSREPEKRGFLKRFWKWLSRGSHQYQESGASCPT